MKQMIIDDEVGVVESMIKDFPTSQDERFPEQFLSALPFIGDDFSCNWYFQNWTGNPKVKFSLGDDGAVEDGAFEPWPTTDNLLDFKRESIPVLKEYRELWAEALFSEPDEKRERSFKAYLEIYESALVSEDPRATEKLQSMITGFVYRMYKTGFEDEPHTSPQARCIELERLGKKYLDNQYFYNALSLLKKEHCGFVLVEQEKAPDYEKIVGRKVLQAGMKRGAAQRTEKERKQKECYALYDKMMSDDHWLKSETKIKKEIAKKMHCAVKTITRYLLERTE